MHRRNTAMSTKKNGKTAKAKVAEKAAPKRKRKAPKPPFRVLIGRVAASGKSYDFEKHSYKAADEAMAKAQEAIDKPDDRLREVLILVNPDAVTA
jgi:hypothetical protein